MFKTFAKNNKDTHIYIQGAYSQNSNTDICGIVFQNYDADTSLIYDMARIGVKDHWGGTLLNGYGDLVFSTAAGDGVIQGTRVCKT